METSGQQIPEPQPEENKYDDEDINNEDTWKVIKAYFVQHGLVSQ